MRPADLREFPVPPGHELVTRDDCPADAELYALVIQVRPGYRQRLPFHAEGGPPIDDDRTLAVLARHLLRSGLEPIDDDQIARRAFGPMPAGGRA